MEYAYTGLGRHVAAAVDESALEFQRGHSAPPFLNASAMCRAADKKLGPNPMGHNRKDRMANAREYLWKIEHGRINDPEAIRKILRDYSREFAQLKEGQAKDHES